MISQEAIDDLFSDGEVQTTPAVARFAGISEATTRAYAPDLGVSRVGVGFAWTRENVRELMSILDADDEDEEVDEECDLEDGEDEVETEEDEEDDVAQNAEDEDES